MKVTLDCRNKTLLVEGDYFPSQVIHFDNYSDWNTILDYEGKPLYDIQVDDDGDDPKYPFECQFAYLEGDKCGNWEQTGYREVRDFSIKNIQYYLDSLKGRFKILYSKTGKWTVSDLAEKIYEATSVDDAYRQAQLDGLRTLQELITEIQ